MSESESESESIHMLNTESSRSYSSLGSDKLRKLKNFLPKPKPKMTSKLRQVTTPKVSVKRRNLTQGPFRPMEFVSNEIIFKYPHDLAIFGHQIMNRAWRNDHTIRNLRKKLRDKRSFWDDLNQDMYERLRVEEPTLDHSLFIQDVDPEFIKIVKDRPIKDVMSVRDYIETVREVLKTKIAIGYREDDLALCNANLHTEQKMIVLIKQNFQRYVEIFEEFLLRDHRSAHGLMRRSNKTQAQLSDITKEYKAMAKKLQGLKMSLFKLEGKWRECKLYQIFAYELSPLWWKKENIDTLAPSLLNKTCLEYWQEINADIEITFDEIMKIVKTECGVQEPKLYFTDPNEVIEALSYMEKQNFNNLIYNEELQMPLTTVKEEMEKAEVGFDSTIKSLQLYIDGIEKEIHWEEERAMELEQLAHKLIFIHFKEIISSPDILNIHCFVEDIYESVIGPNNANLNAHQMTQTIADFYRIELFVLDRIPASDVAQLQSATIKERQEMIRLGEKAAKAWGELQCILRSMKKGYTPPYEKPRYKPVMFRSALVEEPKPPPPPPRQLSESERDYLEHFTDFCEFNSDPKDYGIDIGKCEEKKIIDEDEIVEETEATRHKQLSSK